MTPLHKNVADLHRKLRGETHDQLIMIYVWNYHTVFCTLLFKTVFFGAPQKARWWSTSSAKSKNRHYEKCGVCWWQSRPCWWVAAVLVDSGPGKATLADCTFNPVISGTPKTQQNEIYKYLSYHFTPTSDDGGFYLRVWIKVKWVACIYTLGFRIWLQHN